MTAVDTNILIYAHDSASGFHACAREELRTLVEGAAPWALPWPCVYEFLRVATHPAVPRWRLRPVVAWRVVQALLASPSLMLLSETPSHAATLAAVIEQSAASGNLIHDAHIWTLCLEHGVTELLSGDRDFARFRGLELRNPFASV